MGVLKRFDGGEVDHACADNKNGDVYKTIEVKTDGLGFIVTSEELAIKSFESIAAKRMKRIIKTVHDRVKNSAVIYIKNELSEDNNFHSDGKFKYRYYVKYAILEEGEMADYERWKEKNEEEKMLCCLRNFASKGI